MATEVRWRRGTTAENDAFTGAEGEITVDMDKKGLRVHDNATQGGHPSLTEEAAHEAGYARQVDSVSDLQSGSFPASLKRLWLAGYSSEGDGGHGPLYKTTGTDNGYSVFVDADGNAWARFDQYTINANQGGGIADAVANIGSDVVTLVINDTQTISADLTIPENVGLRFSRNGIIEASAGTETLTINSSIDAGLWQVFGDSLSVTGYTNLGNLNVTWYGATGDGITDDGPSLQKCFDNAFDIIKSGRSAIMKMPAGQFLNEGTELGFTIDGDYTSAEDKPSFRLEGEGAYVTSLWVGSNFSASDNFLTLEVPIEKASHDYGWKIRAFPQLVGFGLDGSRGWPDYSPSHKDPVGLNIPIINGGGYIENVHVRLLGNTTLFCQEVDNSSFYDFRTTRCGQQYLEKEIYDVYAETSSGSTTLTAKDIDGNDVTGVFDGMSGKKVYVRNRVRTIDSVSGDGSSCETTEAWDISYSYGDENAICFGVIKGSISSGSSTLDVSSSVFTDDDIGRRIWIEGAGKHGGYFQGKITSVNSGSQIQVSSTSPISDTTYYAVNTVSDAAVLTGPAIAFSQDEWIRQENESEISNHYRWKHNDLVFNTCRVERIFSAGFMCNYATNIRWDTSKFHGAVRGTNNSVAARAHIILDSVDGGVWFTDTTISHTHSVSEGKSAIQCVGDSCRVYFKGGMIYGPGPDRYFFEFLPSDVDRSILSLNFDWLNIRERNSLPVYVTDSALYACIVRGSGLDTVSEDVSPLSPSTGGGSMGDYFSSSPEYAIDDDNKAEVYTYLKRGFVFVATNSSSNNALIWFQCAHSGTHTNTSEATSVYKGPNVSLQTFGDDTSDFLVSDYSVTDDGEDGDLNLAICTDGIVVCNRRGSRVRVSLTFIGAPVQLPDQRPIV